MKSPYISSETHQVVWDISTHVAILRNITTEAILAGGAIRDLLCRKPVKDLDFFIKNKERMDIFDTFDALPKAEIEETSGYASLDPVFTAYNVLLNGIVTPTQYIFVDNPIEYMENFPVGLCRVGFEVDTTAYRYTKEFEYDRWCKKLSVLNKVSEEYIQRLSDKYPAHKIIYGLQS